MPLHRGIEDSAPATKHKALTMLTTEGCRARRERFWREAKLPDRVQQVTFADPIHVRYFAGCYVTPISSAAEIMPPLTMYGDGRSQLLLANKMPAGVKLSHVDEQIVDQWYDGQSPATHPRNLTKPPAPPCDIAGHEFAEFFINTISQLRRRKDPDEIEVLRECCRAGEAGQAWALAHIESGMTELDVYTGVAAACIKQAGQPVVLYGDFAVSPGPERRGGPPTRRTLANGDLMILDFSVVIAGYRSDFTNTVCVGREPKPEQQRLMDLCQQAMAAGESNLRAGIPCQVVYDAVRGVFEKAGMADKFPHHAGHGLGLMHPEAPYIVRHSTETLLAGDVVTLEPGLYVEGVGGVRIEHNYLITDAGYDRLSQHRIGLS
ncbi:MAG: M24 family metallopeptidase [Gemmataceae bacterium]